MTTARQLYESIGGGAAPLLLDVRNADDVAGWKVEGRGEIDVLNVPYFAFIEDELASVLEVKRWLAGRDRELVVVCAKGGSSEFVADILRGAGVQAKNLEGGMEAWGRATVQRRVSSAPVRVLQIVRFGKGCLSYLLTSGRDALIVDPHRDVESYEQLLSEHGLTLRGVVDTHLHADHISGARLLAETHRAPYHGHAADFEGARFSFERIREGAEIELGGLHVSAIRCLHAPGHTPGSTAMVVNRVLLLSGDTLFIGSAGRPDLAGKTVEWGRELHRTLHERLRELSSDLLVLPAHTAGPHEMRSDGTVAAQLGDLRSNNAAMLANETTFLEHLAASTAQAPAHYARIRSINMGTMTVSHEEETEMELGKNECAMARRQ